MKSISEYFKDKTKNLSFIEIKPNSYIDINGYKVDNKVPLPIVIDELVEEIKTGNVNEEIKISSIVNGMIYTIGVDPEFVYNDIYKEILLKYDEKIESYILFSAIKFLKNGKLDDGLIYLRALVNINPKNEKALYNYSLALEEKGKRLYDVGMKQKGDIFLNESRQILEEITNINPKYALAYYNLGFYYRNSKQFKKCQLTWQKYMQLGDDPSKIEEIRQNLLLIDDCVQYEEGYNAVLNGDPLEGLKKLLPLLERYNDWWNLYFMIGLAYRFLDNYKKAKEYYNKVLELNADQIDTLNEIGICEANLGKFNEAIEYFNKALQKRPNDCEIMCNRGMTYIKMGDIKSGEKDIECAYKLNPKDKIIISCKTYLDQVKKKAKKA